MRSQLFGCQCIKLVRENQPLLRRMQVIVRRAIRFIALRLKPRHGDTNIVRRVSPGTTLDLLNDRDDRIAGVKHVVDDQQTIIMSDFLDDVIETVHCDRTALVNARIRRRAYGDVIGLDATVSKNFLHGHADRSPPAPDRDDHCGFEAALKNLEPELERVAQEILSGENCLVHVGCSSRGDTHCSDLEKRMKKRFISADDLLADSFRLAVDIAESGFEPDFLIGLWRGGSAVGIAVQEGLDHLGISTDHIAVRTSYTGANKYSEMISKADAIRVHGLRYLTENLCAHHKLLIVDDVVSTGSSINALLAQLKRKTRRNLPRDIRVASVWYRPTDKTLRVPDFHVRETQDWLVLPYELTGLSIDELRESRSDISDVVEQLDAWLKSRPA